MAWQRWLVFLIAFSSVLLAGHFYLWKRLVRDPEWAGSKGADPDGRTPRALVGKWAPALLALSVPLSFLASRALPRAQAGPVVFTVFLWLGLASCFFSFAVLLDLVRLTIWAARRLASRWPIPTHEPEPDPARRLFFRRAFAGSALLGGAGLGLVSVYEALATVVVKEVEVTLPKLPPEFDGFRIAQISDIHIGPTLGRTFLDGIVQRVNALKPNLVAITGDLVDGDVPTLQHHTAPLAGLRASDGVFFVTGNHEYYSGAEAWIAELARLGIPTLRNQRVSLGRGDARLDLAGVTDHRAGSFGDAPDYEAALGGRDSGREVVLLAHQPVAAFEASKFGVGLQLSGHTHGGQFWPWTWLILLVQPLARGLGRLGGTQVYVNSGTGYWGPPLRSRTPPEITHVTLRSPLA